MCLDFKEYIQNVLSKFSKIIGLLLKLQKLLPVPSLTLKKLEGQFVTPPPPHPQRLYFLERRRNPHFSGLLILCTFLLTILLKFLKSFGRYADFLPLFPWSKFLDFLTFPCCKKAKDISIWQNARWCQHFFYLQPTLNTLFYNCIKLHWYWISFSWNMRVEGSQITF